MILSPSQREPMSSSIDHITSTLDKGSMSSSASRYMTGAFSGAPTSQLFSSGPGFFPTGANTNSAGVGVGAGLIGASFEDSTKSPLIPLALKIHNLPRDVTEREFKVLFTFAHEFLYSEIHKSSALGDDGLPLSAQGIAYFKSYASASAAQSLLDMRSDIFFMGPLKCEILRDYHADRSDEHSYELRKKGSSRFVFSDPNDSQSASSNLASSASSNQDNKPGSPRSLFPLGSIDGAISGDDMNMYSVNSGANGVNGVSLGGPPPHPHMPPLGGPPPSGKSLLLESRDDDEFNTLVKDPVRFFARDSGFMGFGNTAAAGSVNPNHSSPPQGILGVPGGPLPAASGTAAPVSAPVSSTTSNGLSPVASSTATTTTSTSSSASASTPASAAGASRPTLASIASQGLNNQVSSASLSSNASSSASSPPNRGGSAGSVPQLAPAQPPQNQWEKRRQEAQSGAVPTSIPTANSSANSSAAANGSTNVSGVTRQFNQLSVNTDKANALGASIPAVSNGGGDPSKIVVPYSPTNNSQAIQIMQNGGRVLPPANPADQNPPCNTLYVGNLPPDTSEDELKDLFSSRRGYKRLCFRTKANGPMCFVEFEDVHHATKALEELYGFGLSNSVKGGIRLSYSKNPLGVRGSNGSTSNSNNNNNSGNSGTSNGGANAGNNNGSNGGRYNRYHGGSVNYAEAASQGYMK